MSKDPLKYCKLYKEKGCCHIDGFLCNVETCGLLKDYLNSQVLNSK